MISSERFLWFCVFLLSLIFLNINHTKKLKFILVDHSGKVPGPQVYVCYCWGMRNFSCFLVVTIFLRTRRSYLAEKFCTLIYFFIFCDKKVSIRLYNFIVLFFVVICELVSMGGVIFSIIVRIQHCDPHLIVSNSRIYDVYHFNMCSRIHVWFFEMKGIILPRARTGCMKHLAQCNGFFYYHSVDFFFFLNLIFPPSSYLSPSKICPFFFWWVGKFYWWNITTFDNCSQLKRINRRTHLSLIDLRINKYVFFKVHINSWVIFFLKNRCVLIFMSYFFFFFKLWYNVLY